MRRFIPQAIALTILLTISSPLSALEVLAPHRKETKEVFSQPGFNAIRKSFTPDNIKETPNTIVIPIQKNDYSALNLPNYIQPIVVDILTIYDGEIRKKFTSELSLPFKINKKKPTTRFSNKFHVLEKPADAVLVSKKISKSVQIKKIARYYDTKECIYLGSAIELSERASVEDFGFLIVGQKKYKKVKVSTKNLKDLEIQIPKPKHIVSSSRNDVDLYALDLDGNGKYEFLMGWGVSEDINTAGGNSRTTNPFFFIMKAHKGIWQPAKWVWFGWEQIC